MYRFRGNIAEKFGVNAAVVAEYLYDTELEYMELSGADWYRCSAKQITVDNPFLTKDMVEYAVSKLRKGGVIRSKKITKNSFDHTNWYAFTEYGTRLMEGGTTHDN